MTRRPPIPGERCLLTASPCRRTPATRHRRLPKESPVRIELPPHLPRTSAAVLATAVIGSLGTDVRSDWYRKPGQAGLAAARSRLRPGLDHALRAPVAGIRPRPGPNGRPAETPRVRRGVRDQPRPQRVLELAVLQGPPAALGAGRDPPAGGVDYRPDPAGGPGRPRRRHDARALRRLGRLRHRPQRRHRPAKPRPLTPDQHKGRRQPTRKGHP